uniref:Uncharacterized protein n=1 Tax=uncultured prokaryote TaxID=198431 RepID=A0A0H5Q2M5_9ZZZZ|nr:hypothetical protein [uncultured prokaryote]
MRDAHEQDEAERLTAYPTSDGLRPEDSDIALPSICGLVDLCVSERRGSDECSCAARELAVLRVAAGFVGDRL